MNPENTINKFILTMSFCCFFSLNYGQSLEWANKIGYTGFDNGYSIQTDSAGNVYIGLSYLLKKGNNSIVRLNSGLELPKCSR